MNIAFFFTNLSWEGLYYQKIMITMDITSIFRLLFFEIQIKLEEGEVITKVSGYIGVVPGADTKTEVIRSLTFTTNENEYTYGTAQGRVFSSRPILTNSLIAGFVGRTSTDFLSAIGIYVSS